MSAARVVFSCICLCIIYLNNNNYNYQYHIIDYFFTKFCDVNRRALTDRRGKGILCNLNKGFERLPVLSAVD